MVVWHNLVNKTFKSLRTSNIRPASVEELKVYLKSKKKQIIAIVYYIREGTPEFISQLRRTEVLIIPETKRLFTKSKQSDPEQLKEYLKLHRVVLELKSLRLAVEHKETGSADWHNQGQTAETIADK